MLPIGQWVFLALAVNTNTQTENGFRYTLPSISDPVIVFATTTPTSSGQLYGLAPNSTYFIGGDPYYGNVNSTWLQYVKLYVDYFPNSIDEMINLATLDTGN